MRTVLLLNVYKLTGNDLGDLKRKNLSEQHVLSLLPDYCIRIDNHKIDYTESYLQWTESGDDIFWLFNQIGADNLLDEEISNCGITEFFQDYDLIKIFEKSSFNTYEDMGKRIPDTCHIIVDLSYIGGYNAWTGDSDFDIEIGVKFLTESGVVDYLDL